MKPVTLMTAALALAIMPARAEKPTTGRPLHAPGHSAKPAPKAPAPKANPQFAILSPKATSAAKLAVLELRKLDAAVQVGLNKTQYADRVIDAKAAVDEALDDVPDGTLKSAILASMVGYEDANSLWGMSITHKQVGEYLIAANPILTKYKISIERVSNTGYDSTDLEISNPLVHLNYVESPLNEIWTLAKASSGAASGMLK